MKILLAVPEYPPYHVGGGGEVYQNLAETYRNLGHEVVVVYGYYPTTSFRDVMCKHVDENGITFYRIPELPYPKSKPFLRTAMPPNLRSVKRLDDIIKQERPDVAHLHGYGFIFIYLIYRALRRWNIKYVFTIHGCPESHKKASPMLKLSWKICERMFVLPVLKHADQVTCISNFILNDPRNLRKQDAVVIYNGLKLSDYRHYGADIDVRKRHNVSRDALLIFSLGRLAEMKGFQVIIELLPKLLKKGWSVKYIVAGEDDGYKARLKELVRALGVSECVEFIGFVGLEEKKRYLAQCDLFAIPSLWEPFGLVALEGMAFNKPILSEGNGALAEVLAGYPGWLKVKDLESARQPPVMPHISYDCTKWDWSSVVPRYTSLLSVISLLKSV